MTEKNYVKAILRNLNCSSKTRKQFHDTLIQMITEKKEKGMSMAEIIDTIGDPEEVSNEMDAYSVSFSHMGAHETSRHVVWRVELVK